MSEFMVDFAVMFVAVAPHWVAISSLLQAHLQPLPVQTSGTANKVTPSVYY